MVVAPWDKEVSGAVRGPESRTTRLNFVSSRFRGLTLERCSHRRGVAPVAAPLPGLGAGITMPSAVGPEAGAAVPGVVVEGGVVAGGQGNKVPLVVAPVRPGPAGVPVDKAVAVGALGVTPGVPALAVLLEGVGCAGGMGVLELKLAVAELAEAAVPPIVGVSPPAILNRLGPGVPGVAASRAASVESASASSAPTIAGMQGTGAPMPVGPEPGWVVAGAAAPLAGCGLAGVAWDGAV